MKYLLFLSISLCVLTHATHAMQRPLTRHIYDQKQEYLITENPTQDLIDALAQKSPTLNSIVFPMAQQADLSQIQFPTLSGYTSLYDFCFLIFDATVGLGADAPWFNTWMGSGIIPAFLDDILKYYTTINYQDPESGCTLLHIACYLPGAEPAALFFAQQIVPYGACVTIKDNKGFTPIDYAQQNGYTELVEYLQSQSSYRCALL